MVALIAILVYSIDQEITAGDNSTFTPLISDLVPLTPATVLLGSSWPIVDKPIKNITIDDGIYLEAAEYAVQDLKDKDEIEEKIPSLKVRSPSYRHQKVVATMERGRNLSRLGYLEEYAAKHIHRYVFLV